MVARWRISAYLLLTTSVNRIEYGDPGHLISQLDLLHRASEYGLKCDGFLIISIKNMNFLSYKSTLHALLEEFQWVNGIGTLSSVVSQFTSSGCCKRKKAWKHVSETMHRARPFSRKATLEDLDN